MYVYVCMCVCVYVCMCVCVYVCMCVCMYVCMYIYIYDIMHVFMPEGKRIPFLTYIYIYITPDLISDVP